MSAPSGSKRDRKSIDLKSKYEIIQHLKNKTMKPKALASHYHLKSVFNVYSIKKNEEEIVAKYESISNREAKKTFKSAKSYYPSIEKAMITWMKQLRENNIPLNMELLISKSRLFAEKLGVKDFIGSSKFITGINKRCGINFSNIRGESESVKEVTVEKWIPKLLTLIEQKDPKDVFNLGETGLFWKYLPSKSFIFFNESGKGMKKKLDRVTYVMIANADGSEKRVIIIGKSKKPICFRKEAKLPLEYLNQSNAWINRIF
jgi:hypothetical protein